MSDGSRRPVAAPSWKSSSILEPPSHRQFMKYLLLLLTYSLVYAAQGETSCQASDASSSTCPSTHKIPPKSNWKWDPTLSCLLCNIKRISQSNLLRLYGSLGLPNLYPYPLVIYPDDDDDARNALFVNLTSSKVTYLCLKEVEAVKKKIHWSSVVSVCLV